MKTNEERIERLEQIALEICKHITESEFSWQQWAEPFKAFINEMAGETEESFLESDEERKRREDEVIRLNIARITRGPDADR